MGDEINIRKGRTADWDELADVFHQAVREGAGLYTEDQRVAWSPKPRMGADWSLRMARQDVRVAEAPGRGLVGFMTFELNGYLDCAYILVQFQGKGVFRRLHAPLEAETRQHGVSRLYTHASLHARGAFVALGYRVIRPETVQMGEVWLPRFSMEKLA